MLPNGRWILITRASGGPGNSEIAVLSVETGEVRVLLQGATARYANSGHIVYTSGEGTLLAAPFDAGRLEVSGPSQPFIEGVYVSPSSASHFALSETGVLLYRTGGSASEVSLQVVPFDGVAESIPLAVQSFADPVWSSDGRFLAYSSGPVGERNIYT